MRPAPDLRQRSPNQLGDAQLAEALAQAEAEARQAQARAEALRSEGWRRRVKVDTRTQFPLTFFAFMAGYLISSVLPMLVCFGPSPFMLLPLVMLVAPVLMANFLLRKMEQAAPDKQQFRASVRDFWKLARKPALQGFLLGVGLGLFISVVVFP